MLWAQIGLLIGRKSIMVTWDENRPHFTIDQEDLRGFGVRIGVGKNIFEDEL